MPKSKEPTSLNFSALQARQGKRHKVVSFVATADAINRIAVIDRVARNEEGHLSGFQRPQIAQHINEIKDYLEKSDAVLPNPIVVAFTDRVSIKDGKDKLVTLEIDLTSGPPGFVVDGQQRLSALSDSTAKDFEVFVSALICEDEAELRRQFVLINNTRPLPKSLIYELLPSVEGLPTRFSDRSVAAQLTARLNFDADSSLKGQVHQHTNPNGKISDTALQRVAMNSLRDGVLRELIKSPNGMDRCVSLLSEFYRAVQLVFKSDWENRDPRNSRLVHGTGIVAMGYVMEILAVLDGARDWEEFAKGLNCLAGKTAWTEGEWDFGGGDKRHWKAIQNINRDIIMIAQLLIGIVRQDMRQRKATTEVPPLLKYASPAA
jgi:DGQHR domain-containing protein